MNRERLRRLLGDPGRDPGCELCFEVFDEYVEAVLRKDDVALLFPEVLIHLENCADCREDAEGLLAALADEPAGEE